MAAKVKFNGKSKGAKPKKKGLSRAYVQEIRSMYGK